MDVQKILAALTLVCLFLQNGPPAAAFVQYYQRTRYIFPKGIPPNWKLHHQNQPAKPNYLIHESPQKAASAPRLLKEGSSCRLSSTGQEGQCVLATDCLGGLNELQSHGLKVDLCTFRQNTAVICCPQKRDFGYYQKRISVRKCEEYLDFTATFRFKRNATFPLPKCEPSVPLIVGGEDTSPGEFPHMAAVGWLRHRKAIKWACGGSLISEKFVLTAAHCMSLNGLPPDIVRLGQHTLDKFDEKSDPQDIRITQAFSYPAYKKSAYYHDIALLRLERRPRFSRWVRPACLWQFPDISTNYGVAIGWGKTQFDGDRSDDLKKVDLLLASNKLCNILYKNERKLPNGIIDTQFCAGYLEGGKDTCLGDSGGPIHISVPDGKCINYIIGITSFGRFCAEPNSLGVYTKVHSYLDWIEHIAFSV